MESENNFINSVFQRMQSDTAFRSAFKKADNPDLEYQCWEYLADFKVELDKSWIRLPYVTVFSAMAKSTQKAEGIHEIGEALLIAYDYDKESQPARSRLRRLISCSSTEEVCAVLRPILQFIISKNILIAFEKLLSDLKNFFNDESREKIISKWAQQFYFGRSETEEE